LLGDAKVRSVNPNAEVKVMKLDLEDFRTVVTFADQVMSEVGRLDLLLLNAGINLTRFEKTKDGHEMFANCFSLVYERLS